LLLEAVSSHMYCRIMSQRTLGCPTPQPDKTKSTN
jgi:hypothetical protein